MKNSNIFVMVPVTGKINDDIEFATVERGKEYVKEVTNQMELACDTRIVKTINRVSLTNAKFLLYKDDAYDLNDALWTSCIITYTYHKNTQLGIIEILFENLESEDSIVGDTFFSRKAKLMVDKEYTLDDFIKRLGLNICGKIRLLYINDVKKKTIESLNYLLAGESEIRGSEDFIIKADSNIDRTDRSFYDFCEFYASEKSVVVYVRDFNNDILSKEKNFSEIIFIFMIEVAVLQYAAVYRINDVIANSIIGKKKGHISSSKALELIEKYGKTMQFWDNSIYNYYFDQVVSDCLVEKFKIKELMEQYKTASEHITRVSDLKRNIFSSIESTILNILAFILGVTQIIQIAPQIDDMLKGKIYFRTFIGFGVFIFIIFVIHKNRKENL